MKTKIGSVLLQNTIFGYMVTGCIRNLKTDVLYDLINEHNNVNEQDELGNMIKRFFAAELFPGNNKKQKNAKEQFCEEYFLQKHKSSIQNKRYYNKHEIP